MIICKMIDGERPSLKIIAMACIARAAASHAVLRPLYRYWFTQKVWGLVSRSRCDEQAMIGEEF